MEEGVLWGEGFERCVVLEVQSDGGFSWGFSADGREEEADQPGMRLFEGRVNHLGVLFATRITVKYDCSYSLRFIAYSL